jgi:hypothetical protein
VYVVYKIVKKQTLNQAVELMEIHAPYVARKCEPGIHRDMEIHTGTYRLLEIEDLPGTYQTGNYRRCFRTMAQCGTTGLLTVKEEGGK